MLCPCPPAAICDVCRAQEWLRHKGTIACRGESFVERHRRMPRPGEAIVAVRDLTDDPAQRRRFAVEWLRWARARWRRWQADVDDAIRRSRR